MTEVDNKHLIVASCWFSLSLHKLQKKFRCHCMYIEHIYIKVFINSTEMSCEIYFRSIYVDIATKNKLSGNHDHVGNVM